MKKFIENEKCVWSLQSTVVTRNRGGARLKKKGGTTTTTTEDGALEVFFQKILFLYFFLGLKKPLSV